MKYIFNGVLKEEALKISANNRGVNYGDGVFETIKYANGKLCFWTNHYLRLMASMHILKMAPSDNFLKVRLEELQLKCIKANGLEHATARVKIVVTRKEGGHYSPLNNHVDCLITVEALKENTYVLNEIGLKIGLYNEFYKAPGLLSNIKTTSAQLYVLASTYRQDNNFGECVLLNTKRQVCEAISANLFMVKDGKLITPPLLSGCLNGVFRNEVIEIAQQMGIPVKQKCFKVKKLKKADEIFLTNSVKGIQWVEEFGSKKYKHSMAKRLQEAINDKQSPS